MAVQKSSIDFIQQAGAALSAAREAMANDFQMATASMTNAVLASPAGRELDSHFSSVKAIARLAHELAALDDRLKDAYFTAVALMPQSTRHIQGVADTPKMLAISSSREVPKTELVEDVTPKAKPLKSAPKARPVNKPIESKPRKAPGAYEPPASNPTAGLSANEKKALTFLSKRLSKKQFGKVNGRELAEGSGLPQGSVSIALRKLTEKGALIRNEAGAFRLG